MSKEQKLTFTQQGYNEMIAELDYLKNVRRAEVYTRSRSQDRSETFPKTPNTTRREQSRRRSKQGSKSLRKKSTMR